MLIRLQKYMSERGICSRRQAEKHITAGKIRVNGTVVTTLGTKVDPDRDIVTYDKNIVRDTSQLVYVMLHKPAGVVTSCKQPGEKTVMNLVRTAERVYPIGRLDKDSTGLLLLTNDGELAYRLMHPKFQHEKEYIVETTEPITEGALKKLRNGVRITGVKTQQARVRKLGPKRFKIILREGRNRQIRRMCRKVGTEVKRLKRIRIENIVLGTLPPGQWRNLTPAEYTQLLERVGLHNPGQAAS
jgi:23S rRNA pseudouridine2605 synthase/23S rRNA pseudouridine2604 synthase